MIKKPVLLVFDATNIIHRTFFKQEGLAKNQAARTGSGLQSSGDDPSHDVEVAGLAHYIALATLNKYYTKYHADEVVLCFDRPNNWRKQHTRSDESIARAQYKGNRRQNMTEAQQDAFNRFCEHIAAFEEMARNHTAMVVLAADGLEADDLIAGVVNAKKDTHDIVIVSADCDLIQLLRHDSVTLVDPASGEPRSLVEYNMSADYFVFQKCIRGDTGDNVKSAFPKVRTTRIQKAFSDPYEMVQMMESKWTDRDGTEYTVGDVFKENKLLMDLTAQPPHIMALIESTVTGGFENKGQYNNFMFLKYCGRFRLRKVVDSLSLYQRMLV